MGPLIFTVRDHVVSAANPAELCDLLWGMLGKGPNLVANDILTPSRFIAYWGDPTPDIMVRMGMYADAYVVSSRSQDARLKDWQPEWLAYIKEGEAQIVYAEGNSSNDYEVGDGDFWES